MGQAVDSPASAPATRPWHSDNAIFFFIATSRANFPGAGVPAPTPFGKDGGHLRKSGHDRFESKGVPG